MTLDDSSITLLQEFGIDSYVLELLSTENMPGLLGVCFSIGEGLQQVLYRRSKKRPMLGQRLFGFIHDAREITSLYMNTLIPTDFGNIPLEENEVLSIDRFRGEINRLADTLSPPSQPMYRKRYMLFQDLIGKVEMLFQNKERAAYQIMGREAIVAFCEGSNKALEAQISLLKTRVNSVELGFQAKTKQAIARLDENELRVLSVLQDFAENSVTQMSIHTLQGRTGLPTEVIFDSLFSLKTGFYLFFNTKKVTERNTKVPQRFTMGLETFVPLAKYTYFAGNPTSRETFFYNGLVDFVKQKGLGSKIEGLAQKDILNAILDSNRKWGGREVRSYLAPLERRGLLCIDRNTMPHTYELLHPNVRLEIETDEVTLDQINPPVDEVSIVSVGPVEIGVSMPESEMEQAFQAILETVEESNKGLRSTLPDSKEIVTTVIQPLTDLSYNEESPVEVTEVSMQRLTLADKVYQGYQTIVSLRGHDGVSLHDISRILEITEVDTVVGLQELMTSELLDVNATAKPFVSLLFEQASEQEIPSFINTDKVVVFSPS